MFSLKELKQKGVQMARKTQALRNEDNFDGNAVRKIAVREVPDRAKKDSVVHLSEKQLRQARNRGINPFKSAVAIFCVSIAFTLVASVIYGQVQLTELTEKINVATNSLTELESVEIQLQMKATSNMNVDEIEDYAKSQLGMGKINSNQITYVNLAQQDKGIVVEKTNKNFFANIWDTVTSWVS